MAEPRVWFCGRALRVYTEPETEADGFDLCHQIDGAWHHARTVNESPLVTARDYGCGWRTLRKPPTPKRKT